MKVAKAIVWMALIFAGNGNNAEYLSVSNLARSCTQGPCIVSQSTNSSAANCNPASAVDNSIAVDNYVCTCPGGPQCSDRDPWISIDLGQSRSVFAGRIWDRQSLGTEQRNSSNLDNFVVWIGNSKPYNAVGNTNCYTAITQQHLLPPYIHSFLCGGSGQYVFFQPKVTLSPNTNPSANFAEIQLYSAMPNVARTCAGGACPILQSSYYTASNLCSASNVNDGNYNSFVCTCVGAGYCTDSDPWVQVDLQRSTPIFAGKIWNRGGSPRLNNFRIWVGDGSSTYNATGNTLYVQARA